MNGLAPYIFGPLLAVAVAIAAVAYRDELFGLCASLFGGAR